MFLEIFLTIFILSYLRRSLRGTEYYEVWEKKILIAIVVAAALFVVDNQYEALGKVTIWLVRIFLLGIFYLVYTLPAFKKVKPLMVAVAPLVIIEILNDLLDKIVPRFYDDWRNYFDAAKFFAFVWMIAMWLITKRQSKTLEKQEIKVKEKEKEYQISETLKAQLEVQVAERTAALTQQKQALEKTVRELKTTQAQLVQSEKMASLGELTAGIAHEIQNPLNFVNNFSEVNTELIAEMKAAIDKGDMEEAKALATDIEENEKKINHHGKRADGIVKGMLQHSRSSSGIKEPTDINALADEYLRLAYHGLRAKDKSFNATMKTDFDKRLSSADGLQGKINIIPQDIGRVILNLITNAFYAVAEKKKTHPTDYEPTVTVSTRLLPEGASLASLVKTLEIKVSDNGNGIPQTALDKIFQPFFTTKPTGQGTGLGLSMSYEIITKGHSGELKVENKEGAGASFIIHIPL